MATPVITVDQMRQWERATWAAGKTEKEVIQTVGCLVAQRALSLTRAGEKILILAGKGHNGDDARASQPHLREREVVVLNVNEPKAALEEFQNFVAASRKSAGDLTTPNPRSSETRLRASLLIDGLFGIGLNRPLHDDWKKFIDAINESEIPILSVDVPSGLNAETGDVEGSAIRAEITLTGGAPKRGMLFSKAWPFVGRLEVAPEIGLIPCPHTSELNWTLPEDFKKFPPRREVASHKGSFGHVAIFAGSLGYHGAAVLAARGATRAQPGLVTLFTQENIYVPVAAQLQAAMVHPWEPNKHLPKTCSAILFGPGLAAEKLAEIFKNEMRALWKTSLLPVVADASALDWLPPNQTPQEKIRVITPHPGEAARLLGSPSEKIQGDRPAALRALSKKFGNCFVVLKGHQTLVGRSTGKIFINSSGNPFLAQGGSGDVLAGFLAGLLAQPNLQNDPLTTIRFAVWAHGAAADRLSERKSNWTVEELVLDLGLTLHD